MGNEFDDDPHVGADGELRYAEDDLDIWVVCPDCGSDDAHLDRNQLDTTFACPDCGRLTI